MWAMSREELRGCVACSVECEHEPCKGIGSVSKVCHSKSLNVADTRKKTLCCCASWYPPRGESAEPSTQRCGSLAMQAGPSPVIWRTQGRALWQVPSSILSLGIG